MPKHLNNENDDDKEFERIQTLIETKKTLLANKKKQIEMMSNENKLLKSIKQDYDEMLSFIVQQKQKQIDTLQHLDKYIKDLQEANKLSKQNLHDSRHEQKNIINKINEIRLSIHNHVI